MELATLLFGPLTAPETRRLASRRWVFWVRLSGALLGASVCATVAFTFWVSNQSGVDLPPGPVVRWSLFLSSVCALLAALLVSPALLAGTLAGEKDQGTLGMLLIARVASWEIVVGRLVPRLTQVGFLVLAAGAPLAYLAGLNSMGFLRFGLLAGLCAAVAFGAGGLALAASAVMRRGRDALLVVFVLYALVLIVVAAGQSVLPRSFWNAVDQIDPFVALGQLCFGNQTVPVLTVIAVWLGIGTLGVATATWQLRPSYLRQLGGATQKRSRGAARLIEIGDRPMYWKELFVERTQSLGKLGEWITWLLSVSLIVGSLGSAVVVVAVERFGVGLSSEAGTVWANGARWVLRDLIGQTALPLSWLVQWAIGLRAAVSIASERQQQTWDSLLTSPMEGREIILGKFGGSLYALRWLLTAAAIGWLTATLVGEMTLTRFGSTLLNTSFGAAFIAAVGVQVSLLSTGAARAMAITLGIWLGAAVATSIATAIIALMTLLFLWTLSFLLTSILQGLGIVAAGPTNGFPAWLSFDWTYLLMRIGIYASMTSGIVGWLARGFDRSAGRGWTRPAPARPVWVAEGGASVAPTVAEPIG